MVDKEEKAANAGRVGLALELGVASLFYLASPQTAVGLSPEEARFPLGGLVADPSAPQLYQLMSSDYANLRERQVIGKDFGPDPR